jgi:hypothetical protein
MNLKPKRDHAWAARTPVCCLFMRLVVANGLDNRFDHSAIELLSLLAERSKRLSSPLATISKRTTLAFRRKCPTCKQ